jgi:cytochrome c553
MIRRLLQNIANSAKRADASAKRLLGIEENSLKHWVWTAAKYFVLFGLVMGLGGFLLTVSGIIPIKASSGHWPITRWFLQFSKQRSVATYSLGIEAPPLDEQRLVLHGAGAYETNCRGCHGSPSLQSPRVAQAMTPAPPYLPHTVAGWESSELFVIVKHGIKFTGMPAWPAQHRDDEVWAMVAFLRKFPALEADAYQRLVNGEATPQPAATGIQSLAAPEVAEPAIIASCARCHGRDGLGRGLGAFPKLASQSPEYMSSSLYAYAKGQRHSGVMAPVAAGLNDQEIRELSLYYARLPGSQASGASAEILSSIQRGEHLAREGIPSQRVPPCASCHGPTDLPRNAAYPMLSGQYADYLKLQLELFHRERRGGTAYSHVMRRVAANLTAQQMADAAMYYSSLGPEAAERNNQK